MADEYQRKRATLELSALSASKVMGDVLEGARLETGTPVYDINGEVLFERIPLTGGGEVGYTDVAVNPAMGGVVLAVTHGLEWDEAELLERAREEAADRLGGGAWDDAEAKFVAYSYPKLAVDLRHGDQSGGLLELYSWRLVPDLRKRDPGEPPMFFEQWSFLEGQPADHLARKRERFKRRLAELDTVKGGEDVPSDHIAGGDYVAATGIDAANQPADQRELHFSTRATDHATCQEVRGQQTSEWCVAASVQMLLDFYRYEYPQERIAAELGLGTLAQPNDLPAGQEAKVAQVIKTLSKDALGVTINGAPAWKDFHDEITANRPLVSFIYGHSRTIAGYSETAALGAGVSPIRGLLVYDPWPPNVGVVTRWENIAIQIYKSAFVARLQMA